MDKNKSIIFLTGHNGLVGSAILRALKKKGYKNVITKTRKQLDLLNQKKVFEFFSKKKIDFVFNAAARVGGINANNTKKADFIYENLTIQNNIIYASYKNNVKNLIFLGSSCVYPKIVNRKIKEDDLLTGSLEKTNEPYAVAKIAGIVTCKSFNEQFKTNYKCLMPCNIYGPNDNYDLKTSHFFPALIKKIHIAKHKQSKTVTIWGNGKPKRELLFSEDLAEACIYFIDKKTKETLINIGSTCENTVKDFAKILIKELNYKGKIKFDKSKPNGTQRKKLDLTLASKYKWRAKTNLSKGIQKTYESFLKNNVIK